MPKVSHRLAASIVSAALMQCLSTMSLVAAENRNADSDAVASAAERELPQTGVASWYGAGFVNGRTASGERYRAGDRTAAHRTLPFGTYVRVTNLKNNKSVVVRINNRGPFRKSRIIDLSQQAAADLAMLKSGVARVCLEVLPKEVVVADLLASDSNR